MDRKSYPFIRESDYQYVFFSEGRKGRIIKAVAFQGTNKKNLLNLFFGDQLGDNPPGDMVNTNNHDIPEVMATISEIVKDFTTHNPKAKSCLQVALQHGQLCT